MNIDYLNLYINVVVELLMRDDTPFLHRKKSLGLVVCALAMVWIAGNVGLQVYTTRKLENLASQGRMWEGIVKSYEILGGLDNKLKYVLWGPKFSTENYLYRYLP